MNKHIHYKIIPEHELIIEYYSGQIYLNDLIELKNIEIKNKEYNPNFNFIVDIRDSKLLINEQNIKKFVYFIKANSKNQTKSNSAIVTNTPSQVVTAIIFNELSKSLPINYKIVSTIDAAVNWIGISKSISNKIEIIIKNINK